MLLTVGEDSFYRWLNCCTRVERTNEKDSILLAEDILQLAVLFVIILLKYISLYIQDRFPTITTFLPFRLQLFTFDFTTTLEVLCSLHFFEPSISACCILLSLQLYSSFSPQRVFRSHVQPQLPWPMTPLIPVLRWLDAQPQFLLHFQRLCTHPRPNFIPWNVLHWRNVDRSSNRSERRRESENGVFMWQTVSAMNLTDLQHNLALQKICQKWCALKNVRLLMHSLFALCELTLVTYPLVIHFGVGLVHVCWNRRFVQQLSLLVSRIIFWWVSANGCRTCKGEYIISRVRASILW